MKPFRSLPWQYLTIPTLNRDGTSQTTPGQPTLRIRQCLSRPKHQTAAVSASCSVPSVAWEQLCRLSIAPDAAHAVVSPAGTDYLGTRGIRFTQP